MSAHRFVAASIAVILSPLCAGVAAADDDADAALQRYHLQVAQQKYEPQFAQKYAAPQNSFVVPHAYAVPQKSYAQKYVVQQKYVVPQKSYYVPIKAVHREPRIIYRHHACCKRRGCCSCQSSYQVLLPVSDPKCPTRVIQIPVPVPPCCRNVPWEKSRCGLFVRGVTDFRWHCGYKIRVVWLHRGDVVVHTFGVPVTASAKSYVPSYSYYPPTPAPSQPVPAPAQPSPAPTQPAPALPPTQNNSSGPELLPPGGQEF
jgi:hypothetical protein